MIGVRTWRKLSTKRRHLKSRAPGEESSARAPGDFIAEDGDEDISSRIVTIPEARRGLTMPRKKTEATIVINCSPSTKEGWGELYKVGILSAELLSTWYKGDGMDKALGLRILDLKDKEREGWLALTPPEYAGAAKCSLMIEQLRYELGETNKTGMAELCAITDREIELSADEWKDQLLTTRNHNRRERKKMMPVCSNVACGKPLDVERPLCCAQCKVAVYCDRDCQKEAWKAGHKRECTPYVPPAPSQPAAREPGKTPQASSSSAKKDPSMRGRPRNPKP